MKFLAILGDSLRESIDAKVFYVMIGLSSLLILLALSFEFKPQPGANLILELATAGMNIKEGDLDFSGGGDPNLLILQLMMRARLGAWSSKDGTPANSQPDLPDSTFKIRLRSQFNPVWANPPPDPEQAIRDRFGRFETWRIVKVLDVQKLESDGGIDLGNLFSSSYEVTARVTPAGKRLWPYNCSLFFGLLPLFQQGIPLAAILYVIENYIINGLGAWIAVLVSIVITAFFIPNMLHKGTIDLLLAKPIHRVSLLLYKYIGGLLFILINTTLVVLGVWLAISLRTGIWAPSFLVSILTIVFYFAILYSASVFFGVLTGSPIAAILLTCLLWLSLFCINTVNTIILDVRKQDNQSRLLACGPTLAGMIGAAMSPDSLGGMTAMSLAVGPIPDTQPMIRFGPPRPPRRPQLPGGENKVNVYLTDETEGLTRPPGYQNGFTIIVAWLKHLLPRTSDLSDLTTSLLVRDLIFSNSFSAQRLMFKPITWVESLTVSLGFIVLMLGLACWRFVWRDY